MTSHRTTALALALASLVLAATAWVAAAQAHPDGSRPASLTPSAQHGTR